LRQPVKRRLAIIVSLMEIEATSDKTPKQVLELIYESIIVEVCDVQKRLISIVQVSDIRTFHNER
jgi:hypothetical protein